MTTFIISGSVDDSSSAAAPLGSYKATVFAYAAELSWDEIV